MQNLCKFEGLSWLENHCKFHKDIPHRRSTFQKKLVLQEIFEIIGFRKKTVLKLPKFWIWKNVICIFTKKKSCQC